MADGADICYVECEECGHVAMSFDRERIMEQSEKHMDQNPDHQLFLHVFESDESRKL